MARTLPPKEGGGSSSSQIKKPPPPWRPDSKRRMAASANQDRSEAEGSINLCEGSRLQRPGTGHNLSTEV